MKKIRVFAILCLVLLLAVLSSCSLQREIVGTWVGDGTMDILGTPNYPIEYVNVWTFKENGVAIAEKISSEGEPYTLTFAYSVSVDGDGLTLTLDGISYGIPCRIKGDTLFFETGADGEAEYERVD